MWQAIRRFSRASLDSTDPLYERWMRQMLRERRLKVWVAVDRTGTIVGSGAVWLADAQPRPLEPQPYRPYLLSMFTEPAYRGQGVATAIVRAAVDYARRRGYSRITLHAAPMGRRVYRRLGFERSWEMRKDLVRFPVRVVPARRRV